MGTLSAALVLSGCGGGPPKDPLADVSWSYATDAVILEITADPSLNDYDGQPHTLLLGIYATADAQAFRNLVADPAALAATMASGKVPTTFLQFSRYVVAPGQHSYLILDRAQNTRSVGIAAGYAQMGVANAARLFDVPVVTMISGFIFKTRTKLPAPLVVQLNLGAQGILNAVMLPKGPDEEALQRAQQLEGGGKQIRLDGNASGTASGGASSSETGVVGAANTQETLLRKIGN
ncbi:type VI secretion lipoprotein TssJ [Paraburkholderia mimosarum]|uniref:type VI secretion lipoprotein TssJ n=1 Tax=Paraburkholderia mimosarum TaxID=312026 RepID=UPI001EE2D552|nr:type VI secretion lipoprotein TssJ [Paraburkholderia mimosarum]